MEPCAEKRVSPFVAKQTFQPRGKQSWRTRFYLGKNAFPRGSWNKWFVWLLHLIIEKRIPQDKDGKMIWKCQLDLRAISPDFFVFIVRLFQLFIIMIMTLTRFL